MRRPSHHYSELFERRIGVMRSPMMRAVVGSQAVHFFTPPLFRGADFCAENI
jgi:hypothetical protein